jgi:hypothetical protein
MMNNGLGWMSGGTLWAVLAILVVIVVLINKVFRNK